MAFLERNLTFYEGFSVFYFHFELLSYRTSRLERLSELLLELTDHLSASYLPPATIRILFQLVCRESPLQQMFLTAVATILSAGCGRREFPAVVAVPLPATAARFRAVSASSSDSGLCSVHSSGQAPSPLPPPAGD
jgi:hypothetical protein